MMNYDVNSLIQGCSKIGIDLTEEQIRQFILYYEMLVEKNKVMNLTAITEFEDVIQKHFIDSLSLAAVVNLKEKRKVIDVGTGAGFPGIPLKIVFPQLDVVLLDSLNKRVQFLNKVIEQLQLKDITAVHSRAEDAARNKTHREQYDLCLSRAVANLSSLSEYCLPFVKRNGMFISYKSVHVDEEIQNAKHAIFLLGGKLQDKHEFYLPDSEIGRTFVIIQKEQSTSSKYPRKAGIPAKDPL